MAKTTAEPKKTAEILLYGVIDEFWGVGARWFAQQMAEAADAGAEEIVVRINSAGGSAFEGIAIYNSLASSEIPTRAVVDGLAASAASLVLQGADVREVRNGSFVMVHNPAGLVLGESKDMRKTADDLDALAAGLADIYADGTGKALSEIREIMDAETWYGASDAVDAGFADEVLKKSRAKVAPRNQLVVMRGYRNVPEAVAKMAGIRASVGEPGAQPPEAPADETEGGAEEAGEDEAPPADPDPQPTPPEDPEPAAPAAPVSAEPAAAPEETLPAAYVRDVVAACTMAGMPQRIDGYLAAKADIAAVRGELLEIKCRQEEGDHVDSRKPAKVTGDQFKWGEALKRAGAFAN